MNYYDYVRSIVESLEKLEQLNKEYNTMKRIRKNRLCLNMSEEQGEKLELLAETAGVSQNEILRRLIDSAEIVSKMEISFTTPIIK